MKSDLLELHFAQLAEVWQSSKHNSYSDANKQSYHEKLAELYDKLSKEDFTCLDDQQIEGRKSILNFFFASLQFLDGSTLSLIPFELVKCLEYALQDWIDESEKFIIVTSLNESNRFSFDPNLIHNKLYYENIKNAFGIEFSHKLIQIKIPKSQARNYLLGAILYHELGHFIDYQFQISHSVSEQIMHDIENKGRDNETMNNLIHYFPFLQMLSNDKERYRRMLRSYIAEFFCDLFACQYVGNSPNHFLEYLAGRDSFIGGDNHPAAEKRTELTSNFLEKNDDYFLIRILKAVEEITRGKKLQKRFEEFKSDDFLHLIPYTAEGIGQLHYLFVYGWNIWLNERNKIAESNNMQFELSAQKAHEIVNNLIEKSIGNYIVESNWKKLADVSAT